MVAETISPIGFSDAFHNALFEWAGDGSYPFMDLSYEYDFLDDFTQKTSRIRVASVGFACLPSARAILQAVRMTADSILQAGICPDRIFYRIEEPREDGVIVVRMWGMKELPTESVELQEVS